MNKIQNTENGLKILFICIGNSCRSPMAEAILKHKLSDLEKQRDTMYGWTIDSAAIADWNVGYTSEDRCIAVLQENNMNTNHIARQICKNDFYRFDYIFGMDNSNVRNLRELEPIDSTANIELLGNYDPEHQGIIRDPYFDNGIESFRKCFVQISRCLDSFIMQKINVVTTTA